MGTEIMTQNYTVSTKCTVTALRGFAYIRFNDSRERTLQTGQTLTLEEGDRIVSLLGCHINVQRC